MALKMKSAKQPAERQVSKCCFYIRKLVHTKFPVGILTCFATPKSGIVKLIYNKPCFIFNLFCSLIILHFVQVISINFWE